MAENETEDIGEYDDGDIGDYGEEEIEESSYEELPPDIPMRIAEAYLSIQGEGLYIGAPSTFIRFYGCNQHCLWCDTQNIKADPRWNIETITKMLDKHVRRGYDIVITGGEPLIQPEAVTYMINTILEFKEMYGSETNITVETNGSISPFRTGLPYEILQNVFWSVSPKLNSSGQVWQEVKYKDFLKMPSMQFKFPIDPFSPEDKQDFETIMLFISPELTNVVVQPVARVGITDEEYPAVVVELIEYIQKNHPRVRVIPQMHKFVFGMNSKSV